jgi:D-amino-acid dehydrogenase
MIQEQKPIVVVGGGIIGAMCAWYLVKSGHRVTIIDRAKFGAACSHGNCGYVSPSHVLPLTTPGGVTKALKSMLSSNSPFYIKPRISLALWGWLLRFARRCNQRDMLEAAQSIHALLQSSKELYVELVRSQQLECEWQDKGMLFVYQDEHELHEYEAINELTREKFGVSAKQINGDELIKLEPALKPGVAGAWYFDCDSHLRPDKLMSEMKRLLQAHAVKIVEQCELKGLVVEHDQVQAVQTTQGDFPASQLVIATGAMTPFLNQHLGCKIPIQPGKGYSLTMPRPSNCPKIPMIFEQHRVAITPMLSAYRIGSTMEFAGYDDSINEKRLGLLRKAAEIYLHEPYAEPITEKWYGWRPMTWDSKPFIDRLPRIKNGWVAVGHNMLGISMSTATGKLIAEMINGEKPHLDIQPLRLSRI